MVRPILCRILQCALCCMLCATLLCSCAAVADTKITSYQDLAGKRIATSTSDIVTAEKLLATHEIEAQLMYFNTFEDMVQAVLTNKADAVVLDQILAKIYMRSHDSLTMLPVFGSTDWCFSTSLENTQLVAEFDPVIRRLKADGTIKRLEEKWSQPDLTGVTLEPVTFTGEKGILTAAVAGTFPAYCFYQNGELAGSDIDVIRLITAELGYGLDFLVVAEDALFFSAVTGKADLCAVDIAATPERAQEAAFFEPIYTDSITALVRK